MRRLDRPQAVWLSPDDVNFIRLGLLDLKVYLQNERDRDDPNDDTDWEGLILANQTMIDKLASYDGVDNPWFRPQFGLPELMLGIGAFVMFIVVPVITSIYP